MSIHWGGRGAGHISRWSASTSGVPSLVLDFLTTTSLDSRITFTRASTATFIGSNGLIQSAAINAPRFDYNPVTSAAKGLLIEEQRTNLRSYSEQFNNAVYAKSGVLAFGSGSVVDATTSPDGTVNADLITENTTTGRHGFDTTFTGIAAGNHTWSIFLKSNGRSAVDFVAYGSGMSVRTISNVAISSGEDMGNGWYRVSWTFNVSAPPTSLVIETWMNTGSSGTYTGNGTSGMYFWGSQAEVGAFKTSYIPTVASQVTRSPDIATMTGTNFSSWFNASEGTFVASYEASPNLFATYFAASNGTVGQNSIHFDNDSGGTMRAVYYSGSVAQAILSLGAYGAAGTVNTVASAYAVNDFAASRNGGAVVTDTSGALPVSLTQLNIGADPSGAAVNVTNTHIRSIKYYNKRIYNSQLEALSI